MKKFIGFLAALALVGSLAAYSQVERVNNVVGNPASGIPVTLAGSSANAVSMPPSQSDSNATSTDPALLDGNQTIQQAITTAGSDFVWLTGLVKAGTATSTWFIKQQGSFNQSDWFNIHASSTPAHFGYSTTTPIDLKNVVGTVFDPPTATTTFALKFYTGSLPFTRFVMYADDLASDPADGIQAFVQATPIKQLP